MCHDDIDGLVQDCSIFSVLAMEILQSYTEPSILILSIYVGDRNLDDWFKVFVELSFSAIYPHHVHVSVMLLDIEWYD